jgi:hypothetical protein
VCHIDKEIKIHIINVTTNTAFTKKKLKTLIIGKDLIVAGLVLLGFVCVLAYAFSYINISWDYIKMKL